MLRLPQELLPAMPPSVAWAAVETSTGYQRPVFFRWAFRWSSTMPGSTVAVRCSASTSSTLRTCLEKSITRPAPTVWPHWLVPPPRGTTGTFRSRQMSSARRASSAVRGTNTPTGTTW
jgi:hypothetical protein